MRLGRRLGIDYGKTRVGIALSDDQALVCTPLITLKNDSKLFSKISQLIDEYQPVCVYVGKPKHLSGIEGQTVEEVAKFVARFSESFQIPVKLIDERMTSKSAERRLREAGKDSRSQLGLVDQLAAMAILELGIEIDKRGPS